ncbi:MAG: exodeoxyribonuclease VII small subunit [Bacteriovoracaceae bacterium]|nr:exodeoxyribonuclease VII small subunit [Bacteriovoracaceae bacterium]
MSKKKIQIQGKDFEKKLEQLEELLGELESGKLNLEESLKKFEIGVELYKGCKDYLGQAERKVNLLKENLKVEDF